MANYVKATNFYTKDALSTGNPAKIIKGSEIDDEFNAISTAINSKADTTSPTFTGTPIAPTATAGNNTTQVATTAFVTTAIGTPGTMAAQNANAVAITGGTIAGTFTGNITGNVTGNVTGSSGSCTGNAATATALSGPSQSVGWGSIVSRSVNTWYSPTVNCFVSVKASGSFRNGLDILAGTSTTVYTEIATLGDDINNNTKAFSYGFPVKAGAYYYIRSPSTSVGTDAFEFINIYEAPAS